MSSFIKAAEIWHPDARGLTLELGSSYYGELNEFAAVSKDAIFRFGEGLPGRTWAERRPLVWANLENGEFKRVDAAKSAGIACGLSIPIFAGEFLLAVVVLFFAKDEETTGAVEVWENIPGSNNELKLADGYYGELKQFEWVSRRLAVIRGRGLPGMAWKLGVPFIIDDIGESNTFLRARNARASGITTGLAIPIMSQQSDVQILTFLSAKDTPIARRFEIWLPDAAHRHLNFSAGHCETGNHLAAQFADAPIAKGDGPLGEAWLTGKPVIAEIQGEDTRMLILPVIASGLLTAMVVFVF